MLETIMAYATMAAPWILVGVGIIGLFLLAARAVTRFCALPRTT